VAGDATIAGAPQGRCPNRDSLEVTSATVRHDNLSVDGTSTLKGGLTGDSGDS
jgi:hypothetical protein